MAVTSGSARNNLSVQMALHSTSLSIIFGMPEHDVTLSTLYDFGRLPTFKMASLNPEVVAAILNSGGNQPTPGSASSVTDESGMAAIMGV